MNKHYNDTELVVGYTYIFILTHRFTEIKYAYMGLTRDNRIKFSYADGNICTFIYDPDEDGFKNWILIKTNFKFGR